MLPVVVADLGPDVLAQYMGLMADDRAGEDKAQFLTATFDMRVTAGGARPGGEGARLARRDAAAARREICVQMRPAPPSSAGA